MKPSRHPVLKWIGIVLLAIILAAVLFRVVVGYWADSKLQAELDAIAARGEPIRWADLARPPIPDEQNAAVLYREAVRSPFLKRISDGGAQLRDLLLSREWRDKHKDTLEQLLTDAEPALRLCRDARSRGRIHWEIDFHLAPEEMVPSGAGNAGQTLVTLICLAAISAHDRADDTEAVEYLRDAMAYARSLHHVPVLISHLLYLSHTDRIGQTVEQIAPSFQVGKDLPAVHRDKVQALVGQLLDEGPVRAGLLRAFMGERIYTATQVRERTSERDLGNLFGVAGPAMGILLRPILTLEGARVVAFEGLCVRGARTHGTKDESFFAIREAPHQQLEDEGVTRWISAVTIRGIKRVWDSHCRSTAFRRMAGVALAIRLYQTDHGRRPDRLEDLIGRYISSVPNDPCGRTHRPIAYRPNGDPPLLYSVGEDAIDDGGAFEVSDWGDLRSRDDLFFLNGDRPQDEFKWDEPEDEGDLHSRDEAFFLNGDRPQREVKQVEPEAGE